MVITNIMMVRNKAPIKYITQSGVVGVWVGGGGIGGSTGCAGAGNTGGGAGDGGVAGTGIRIGGTGVDTDEDGNGSVVKVLTALQAL